jgi:hypothetical protein
MYAASKSITKENEGPKSQASMICNARACHVQYASGEKTSRAKIRYATVSNPATSRLPYPCPEREGKRHQAMSGMNRNVADDV